MIDPQLLPFIEQLASDMPAAPEVLPIGELRSLFESIEMARRGPRPDGMAVEDIRIAGSGGAIHVRLYRPVVDPLLPCVVFLHGGGWVLGSIESHDDTAAWLAAGARALVVSVGYRLAPEHPFPAALEDGLAVLDWAFSNAQALGIDVRRVVVAGDSSGGNLAAAISLQWRGEVARPLRGQALIYPGLGMDFGTSSCIEERDSAVLPVSRMKWYWDQYVPRLVDRANPLAVPLLCADLRGNPETFIAVAEHDALRDDGIAYAQRLRECGVSVTLDFGVGLIHGYSRARRQCTAAQQSYLRMCEWIGNLAVV